MSTTTYLVTGANKGIGFELVKKLSEDKKKLVYATVRSLAKTKDLKALERSNIRCILLDVLGTLDEIKEQLLVLGETSIDVVILNAGVKLPSSGGSLAVGAEDYEYHLKINTLGSIKVYQALYPYWSKESESLKKYVFISSLGGSIGSFFSLFTYGYGMSKAALNFFLKQISIEHTLSDLNAVKNSISIAVHPGTVKTDLASPDINMYNWESITPKESAASIVRLIESLKPEDNGTFKSYDGSEIPW